MSLYPKNAVIMAPLSGYTDLPFRNTCRSCGCKFAFTPMIDAGSMVNSRKKMAPYLERGNNEDWLGIQLLGGSPQLLAEAVSILNDYNFDVIDLNMGCCVPKVMKKGAGAALEADLMRAASCIEFMVKKSRVPVTAKIRVLSDTCPSLTINVASILAKAGLSALTIHGRVIGGGLKTEVAVDVIRAVRESVDIEVIANGGVFDRQSAEWLRCATGCDKVMVARGAIGNPWIFAELGDFSFSGPGHIEFCQMIEQHVTGMMQIYGEEAGIRKARKIIHAYLSGRGYRRQLKVEANSLCGVKDFNLFMKKLQNERLVK